MNIFCVSEPGETIEVTSMDNEEVIGKEDQTDGFPWYIVIIILVVLILIGSVVFFIIKSKSGEQTDTYNE